MRDFIDRYARVEDDVRQLKLRLGVIAGGIGDPRLLGTYLADGWEELVPAEAITFAGQTFLLGKIQWTTADASPDWIFPGDTGGKLPLPAEFRPTSDQSVTLMIAVGDSDEAYAAGHMPATVHPDGTMALLRSPGPMHTIVGALTSVLLLSSSWRVPLLDEL